MRHRCFPTYYDQLCFGAPCPYICNAGGGGGGKGGGGSYEAPPPPPAPAKAEVAKPVSESATAARTAQKEKAQRAAGIQGSILSKPMDGSSGTGGGKTLLGQ